MSIYNNTEECKIAVKTGIQNRRENEMEKFTIEYTEIYKGWYEYEAENARQAKTEFQNDLLNGNIRTEKMECYETNMKIQDDNNIDYLKLYELLSSFEDVTRKEIAGTYHDIDGKTALAVRMMQEKALESIRFLQSILVYEM